jgi:hypothetical protein
VAGLSSFLVLVIGVALWVMLRDDPYVAPTPSTPTNGIQPAPAAALLQQLTTAVRRGDGDAAAALADEADPDAQSGARPRPSAPASRGSTTRPRRSRSRWRSPSTVVR